MRKAASIGIGAGAAAIVALSAGAAAAATGGPANGQQAGGSAAAAAPGSVSTHITRSQAAAIARAKVPHSRVIEIESDDLHDRQVWKVQLRTAHGRVIVDVDKKTGRAVIIQRGGRRGPGDARMPGAGHATVLVTGPGAAARDDHGRDFGDDDAARDAAEHRGDRAAEPGDDRGHDGRHHRGHDDRGDDGPGR